MKKLLSGAAAALIFTVLSACGGTPYTPAPAESATVDAGNFNREVDSFVVLLDTSGSMKNDETGQARIHAAQDLVADFNNAVPPLDFDAGLVIFGKGAGTCYGTGEVNVIYGMAPHDSSAFLRSLSSIGCAANTTPIVAAVDTTAGLLTPENGQVAVVIVSDFKWSNAGAVEAALAKLRAQHDGRLCVHTVRVDGYEKGDEVISRINPDAGCGSNVLASDVASGAAMTDYAAEVLMSPIKYEKHTLAATTLFDFDRTVIKPEGKAALRTVTDNIKHNAGDVVGISIAGHTDSVGTPEYNQALSLKRAKSVQGYLMVRGISRDLMQVEGKGEGSPIADNDNTQGRARNRRVEIGVSTSRRIN